MYWSQVRVLAGPPIKIFKIVRNYFFTNSFRVLNKASIFPSLELIIEGLSLARTQKEEFSSILNSNDGDINILFKTLEEFSNN